MKRITVVAATLLLASAGVLGLAGCRTVEDDQPRSAAEVTTALDAESDALTELGFDQQEWAPAATASAGTDKDGRGDRWRKRHGNRALLGKNTLHGEIVVQTRTGTKTIAVQRGTVTAIDGESMTVKSADGFTMTWSYGEKLRVVQRRTSIPPDQIEVGALVGVAGAKAGDGAAARLIVVPHG